MATRSRRQINYYPDSTTGTINITHGSPQRPSNNGFFGSGFTNTTSSKSSKKRRRRRKEAERRRREEAARARAEAQAAAEAQARAQAQLQAEANARAQAEAHARAQTAATEAQAKAERERVIAAHQHALETLPHSQTATKAELDQKHIDAVATLPSALATDAQFATDLNGLSGKPLLDAIIHEKAHINYLISQRSDLSNQKRQTAYTFANQDPLEITVEQYKAILGSRSVNADQAHQVHRAWTQAYKDALEANLHIRASEHLGQLSDTLTNRYAEQTNSLDRESESAALKHLAEANRFWSVVAGPTAPGHELPSIGQKARALAEKLFTQQASKLLGRALPHLALLYPTEVADGEIGPSILATAASGLGVAKDVDLDFIANRNGTIDVTHRMTLEEMEGELTTAWTVADGISVGAQVPVRSFVYNPGTSRYEFTRDGDTKPTLVWTPSVTPGNSSTSLPSETRGVNQYSGAPLTPALETLGDYPTYDIEEIEDYVLVFPAESGLDPVYVMFKSPRYLPGIVSGVGGPIDSNWEAAASKGLGSPIPSAVADALRDKRYSEFRNLKKAIWREMSKLPEVVENMSQKNMALIRKGNSPIAPYAEQKGGRVWYEIHHILPISEGGLVYELDNLVLNSPVNHDKIHHELRTGQKKP